MRTILTDMIYGAKIDNEYDSKILTSLVEHLFTPKCFTSNYQLYDTEKTPDFNMPEAHKY